MARGRAGFRHMPSGRPVYRPTSVRIPSSAATPSVRPEGEWSANSPALCVPGRLPAASL
jgi:hypothetical protein